MSIEDLLHPWLSAYVASPQWVKSAVGHSYRLLPAALRRGRHYARFGRELAKGPSDARASGLRKLTYTLRWAIETVPAYRGYANMLSEIEHDPLSVLRRIKPVTKEDLKKAPDLFLSHSMPKRARLKTFTGGSTANPMMFYLHKGVSRPREYAFMDDFHRRVGLTDSEIVLALRGRTVPTAGVPGGRGVPQRFLRAEGAGPAPAAASRDMAIGRHLFAVPSV